MIQAAQLGVLLFRCQPPVCRRQMLFLRGALKIQGRTGFQYVLFRFARACPCQPPTPGLPHSSLQPLWRASTLLTALCLCASRSGLRPTKNLRDCLEENVATVHTPFAFASCWAYRLTQMPPPSPFTSRAEKHPYLRNNGKSRTCATRRLVHVVAKVFQGTIFWLRAQRRFGLEFSNMRTGVLHEHSQSVVREPCRSCPHGVRFAAVLLPNFPMFPEPCQ